MNMNLREIGSEPITPWSTLSKSLADRNKNISDFINKSFDKAVTSKESSTRNSISSSGTNSLVLINLGKDNLSIIK